MIGRARLAAVPLPFTPPGTPAPLCLSPSVLVCCLRPPRCVSTGPEVVRLAGMANERERERVPLRVVLNIHPPRIMPAAERKRTRASAVDEGRCSSIEDACDASSAASIELVGGLAEKPSTIAKFRDGRLTDVEVVAADGTTFRAHALCITSGSEYFECLLAGERWADTAGRPLLLPEVPKQGLSACLEFIYLGSCAVADEAELMVVLEAAAYLQIPPLVDAAAKAMSAHLSAATALAFWAVADRQGLSQLAADAVSAAARHFEQIAATPAWLSTPAEMVRVLLASDQLKNADSEAVYSATVRWLHAQAPPPAEADALALLRLVNASQWEAVAPSGRQSHRYPRRDALRRRRRPPPPPPLPQPPPPPPP